MAHIKDVTIGSNTYLLEPTVYAATAGSASAITASITNFTLATGVVVTLKITTDNSASATLNVNDTGAKYIKYNNANIVANVLKANNFYSFVYDGTDWQLIGELNTTYTFKDGTNGFTVTPNGGSAQTIKVTPSITNNVTGSGTSGYLAKFNGANTITNGPQLGTSTTTFLNNAGSWAVPSDTKNTAGSTNSTSKLFLIGATMQAANPTTNSYVSTYTSNGLLSSTQLGLNVSGTEKAHLEWNATDNSIDFIFT